MEAHCEQLSEECILRHQKQDEMNVKINDIHDALLGTALSLEPSIKQKVNEIYTERKNFKKWIAGSIITVVVFIFTLGMVYEKFNSFKKSLDDLTIRVQSLEHIERGGYNR